ncbi:MAG: hypothetical protein IPL53_16045 [Ignavibacteria bacterium]|nr:hypothetical protein [Ignavibacteria bacterium]
MNFKKAVLLSGFLFLFNTSCIYAQIADSTYEHYTVSKDINVNRINFAQEEFGFVISSNLNSTEDILNRFEYPL